MQISATVPTRLLHEDNSGPLELSGRQSITVVFSRAVIPLGLDLAADLPRRYLPFRFSDEARVRGRGRWLATSIFRWDPTGDWPSDLDFQLIWNLNLTSYDGISIDLDGIPNRVELRTPSLRATLIGVGSAEALRLTDEHWDGQIGLDDDRLPEVPPDGSIVIEFSRNVNLRSLQSTARMFRLIDEQQRLRENMEIEVQIRTCYDLNDTLITNRGTDLEDSCAVVDLIGADRLTGDEVYGLVLPDGWEYNPSTHGPLQREILIELHGLRRFRIPFQQRGFEVPDSRSEVQVQPTGSFLDGVNMTLWLPHGLAEDVELEDLKSAIHLQWIPWDSSGSFQEVDFRLETGDRGTLFLLADVVPAQKYRILIDSRNDIRDGFGLPLETSELDFATSQITTESAFLMPPFFAFQQALQMNIDGTESWNGMVPFISRRPAGNHEDPNIKAWSLIPRDDEDIRRMGFILIQQHDLRHLMEDRELIYETVLPQGTEFSSTMIPVQELLDRSKGMILMETPSQEPDENFRFVARELDFQVARTAMSHKNRQGHVVQDIVLLLSSAIDGSALPDANITVMRRVDMSFRRLRERQESHLEIVDRLQTDEEGLVKFQTPRCRFQERCLRFAYYIETESTAIFVFDEYRRDFDDFGYDRRQSLVLDRRLVDPGDTLHVAGFLASREDNHRVVPYGQNPSDELEQELVISPSFDPDDSDSETESFLVEIDPQYGTFQLDIDVPRDTPPGEYSLRFGGGYQEFTVGQPRVLTAGIDIQTPSWIRPDGDLTVVIEISSLLGASISDAEVVLRWGNRTENFDRIELQTDSNGLVNHTIDLATAETPFQAGDEVNLEVEYIGPTREVILQERYIPVALTNLQLVIATSMFSPIPTLTEFGGAVLVSSRNDEEVDLSLVINLELLEVTEVGTGYEEEMRRDQLLRNQQDEGIVLTSIKRCRLLTNQTRLEMYESCRFMLSSLNQHMIRACIRQGQEMSCEVRSIGRRLSTWNEYPLSEHQSLSMYLVSRSIDLNGEAEFYVDLPLDNVRGVVMWGNDHQSKHQVIEFKNSGIQRFSIQTGEECYGGCYAYIALSAPRQTRHPENEIPVVMAFDLTLPSSSNFMEGIEINNQELPRTLNLTMNLEGESEAIVEPGSNTTISIFVQRCPGDPNEVAPEDCENLIPARNTQIVVFGVDKAYLELEQNELQDLVRSLTMNYLSTIGARALVNRWINNGVYSNASRLVDEILALDPWRLADALDSNRLTYNFADDLRSFIESQAITINPPGLSRVMAWFGRVLQQAPDPPAMASGRSLLEQDSDDPDVRVQTDFKVTPLVSVVKTDNQGRANVHFVAPDNTGTFVIRAYAAGRQAQHGMAEIEVINRLPLTLTPSVPRFVRIGDSFEAGVVITVLTDASEDSNVTVSLLGDRSEEAPLQYPTPMECNEADSDCLEILDRQSVPLDEDGQVEVRFEFLGVRLGAGNFTIRADFETESDALQLTVPVLAQQDSISVASSFTLRDDDASEEGIEIPEAVPGSGSLELLAGIGFFPAVQEMTERVLGVWQEDPEAIAALANISIPFILDSYDLDQAPENRRLFNRAIRAFQTGLRNLQRGRLTSSRYGLEWSVSSRNRRFRQISTYLNSISLILLNELPDRPQRRNSILSNGLEELRSLGKVWRRRFVQQLIEDAESFVEDDRNISTYSLLNARLALGVDWQIESCPSESTCTNPVVARTLSMDRLNQEYRNGVLSFSDSILLASIWMQDEQDVPEELLEGIRNRFRTTGRTAYIAEEVNSTNPISPDLQAQVLRILLYANQTQDPLIDRLSQFVASGNAGSSFPVTSSPVTLILKMLSLSEYDQKTGSADPDLSVEIQSSNQTLLEGQFTSSSDPVISRDFNFEELDNPVGPLMFRSEGTGEVTLTASLEFIPAELLPFPTYRGIFVERVIRQVDDDGDPNGSPLTAVPLGTIVVISLQITSPDDLTDVVIRALMPGGLEPIDPLITEAESAATTCELEGLHLQFAYWYWPLCPRQETRPSEVTFRYDRLRSGTNGVHFRAVAASVGSWVLPPIQAFVSAQPEVMGLSIAGEFEVCENCNPSFVDDEVIGSVPVNCPENCSGVGVCDLNTGECRCDRGFSGPDCATIEQF